MKMKMHLANPPPKTSPPPWLEFQSFGGRSSLRRFNNGGALSLAARSEVVSEISETQTDPWDEMFVVTTLILRKSMLNKTVVVITFYVLIVSFIISLHTGLLKELVHREVCSSKYGWKSCTSRQKIKESNVISTERKQVEYWQRILSYVAFFPAIVSFLVIAGVTDWTNRKENIGLYVSIVLAIQSLVYMVVVMAHSSKIEHLLFGALLNVLYGDENGAIIIAWVFAVATTGQDLTRTLAFIFIEGMVYLGRAFGNMAADILPGYIPLSYIYSISFSLSVISLLIIYFGLPTHVSIMGRRSESEEEADLKMWKENQFGYRNHPFNTIKSEYIAGVVMTVFLTELARGGYNAVIRSVVVVPPFSLSFQVAHQFIFSSMAIQGVVSIFLGIILIKYLYASDSMLAMIALSSAAFWMALTGFATSQAMLYILTCCLGIFAPLAMASLISAATKESDIVSGNIIMLLAIIGVVSMLCRAFTTYGSKTLVKANLKVHRQFSLLLFAILQLMAFIVIGSISLTFKKPIVELKKKEEKEQRNIKTLSNEDNTETETDTESDIDNTKKPLLPAET